MAILQLTTEKENTLCFDFLEEKRLNPKFCVISDF